MPGLKITREVVPTFPEEGLNVHPLLVVDFEKIASGDKAEIDTLWKASTELGFFYLKNHGVDPERMFEETGAPTFALSLEEKMPYEQGDSGLSFGYKAAGANLVDEKGNLDKIEFINISKDDAMAYPTEVHRSYPEPTRRAMAEGGPVKDFISRADAVTRVLIEALTERLGLPKNAILDKHIGHSPSEARTIKKPPTDVKAPPEKGSAIGSHTDFGTFSFLFNRGIGGLQVLVPGSATEDDWAYIKPLDGCAVCNLGDCMSIFSGGILRSNMHRVVSPPGDQALITRWSQVYFIRPAFDSILEPLTQSPQIANAASKWDFKIEPNTTSKTWFMRRIKNQRTKVAAGNEAATWKASRGTEHRAEIA